LKLAAKIPNYSSVELALLQGKLQEAAGAVERANDNVAGTQHALLYLAALKAGNPKLAEEQWQSLLAQLEKSGRHQRRLAAILAGRQPFDTGVVRRLPIETRQKRVLLAVAAKQHPEQGKELLPLARSLNFFLDGTSLCLWKVLDE
jgi:hypothetical protein